MKKIFIVLVMVLSLFTFACNKDSVSKEQLEVYAQTYKHPVEGTIVKDGFSIDDSFKVQDVIFSVKVKSQSDFINVSKNGNKYDVTFDNSKVDSETKQSEVVVTLSYLSNSFDQSIKFIYQKVTTDNTNYEQLANTYNHKVNGTVVSDDFTIDATYEVSGVNFDVTVSTLSKLVTITKNGNVYNVTLSKSIPSTSQIALNVVLSYQDKSFNKVITFTVNKTEVTPSVNYDQIANSYTHSVGGTKVSSNFKVDASYSKDGVVFNVEVSTNSSVVTVKKNGSSYDVILASNIESDTSVTLNVVLTCDGHTYNKTITFTALKNSGSEVSDPSEFFNNYLKASNNATLGSITGVVCYVGTSSTQKIAGVNINTNQTVYVFSNKVAEADWKNKFKVGDEVTISSGVKGSYNGLHEYVITDLSGVSINSSNNTLPEHYDITSESNVSANLEKYQASLVKVTGILKISSNKYYIDVNGTRIQIYSDKKFASVDLSILEDGNEYEIYGLMCWYNGCQIIPLNSDFAVLHGVSTNEITSTKRTFNESLSQEENGPLTYGCLPSVGSPNVLVIPVNLNSNNKTDKVLNDIKVAFTGTESETGWESVNSYYKESSYGKLDIKFNVLNEWFTPSKSASYYNSYWDDKEQIDGSILILKEALKYYDSKIDFSQYDLDNDGSIDSIWLIYNSSVNFKDDNSLYWAFTSWCYDETTYDGKVAYYYAFAGIDFMYSEYNQDQAYDTTDIKIDAHTYIHETGHLLGLDDYYDYDDKAGASGYGYYGCDMMDANIGDHGAISKLLLGWVSPTVVTGKGTISVSINDFATTGDCIIVSNKEVNSIYANYYMIELYTNKGLNSHDKPYDSSTMTCGVRVTKVNAELNWVNGQVELNNGSYQTGFKYDNSDEPMKFVEVVTNKNYTDYGSFQVDMSCLFGLNSTLSKTGVYFTMTVNSLSESNCTLSITIK